jgi:hypothetical protein
MSVSWDQTSYQTHPSIKSSSSLPSVAAHLHVGNAQCCTDRRHCTDTLIRISSATRNLECLERAALGEQDPEKRAEESFDLRETEAPTNRMHIPHVLRFGLQDGRNPTLRGTRGRCNLDR